MASPRSGIWLSNPPMHCQDTPVSSQGPWESRRCHTQWTAATAQRMSTTCTRPKLKKNCWLFEQSRFTDIEPATLELNILFTTEVMHGYPQPQPYMYRNTTIVGENGAPGSMVLQCQHFYFRRFSIFLVSLCPSLFLFFYLGEFKQ